MAVTGACDFGIVEVGHHSAVADAAGNINIDIRVGKFRYNGRVNQIGNGKRVMNRCHMIFVAVQHFFAHGACGMAQIEIAFGYVVNL